MTGIDGAVPPPYRPNDVSTATGGEPRLDQPYYGIGLAGAVKRFFTKYAVFSGRASRSEYWWVQLAVAVLGIVLGILTVVVLLATIDPATQEPAPAVFVLVGLVAFLLPLAILVPSLAITARRLHDADLSALFLLLLFVPSVGGLIIIILTILPSKPEGARFDAVRA